PGCLQGGGRDNCELRACAVSKGIDECSQCDALTACAHAEVLQHMRSGALAAGLFVKTEPGGKQEFIDARLTELKSRLPCCILFMDD
ncbi:MAG: hypothetical protein KGJ80_19565, partial [Chloroflexota bacterium]|nr:hypothetical protein [Chloroflexota bacterium]